MSEGQPDNVWHYQILIAEPEDLSAACGFQPHPEIFNLKPFGNRVVVVRERPKKFSATCPECGRRNLWPEDYGKCDYCGESGLLSMQIPDTATDVPCVGWIVAVGPEAHLPNFPRTVPLSQEQMLCAKVLFAPYGGNTLQVGEVGETLYEGSYLIIEATQLLSLEGDVKS